MASLCFWREVLSIVILRSGKGVDRMRARVETQREMGTEKGGEKRFAAIVVSPSVRPSVSIR